MNINPDDVLPSEERVRELEMIQMIAQLAQAQGAQTPAQDAEQPAQDAGGAPPGVSQPPATGGVAERRSAA